MATEKRGVSMDGTLWKYVERVAALLSRKSDTGRKYKTSTALAEIVAEHRASQPKGGGK